MARTSENGKQPAKLKPSIPTRVSDTVIPININTISLLGRTEFGGLVLFVPVAPITMVVENESHSREFGLF